MTPTWTAEQHHTCQNEPVGKESNESNVARQISMQGGESLKTIGCAQI